MNAKITATLISFMYMAALGCIALKKTVGLEGWETFLFIGCITWLSSSSFLYAVSTRGKKNEHMCIDKKGHKWEYPRIGVRDCRKCKAHEYMMVDPRNAQGRWIGIHHIGKLSDD